MKFNQRKMRSSRTLLAAWLGDPKWKSEAKYIFFVIKTHKYS